MLEFYIIELNKAKNAEGKNLDSWLKFINNPREKIDMENKEIKKAKEILEEISQDEHERYLAELRQKYIMDQKATEDAGYDKGLKAGLQQGLEQRLEQGLEQAEIKVKQKQHEIAKKMKEENFSLETILRITGLTDQELKNL